MKILFFYTYNQSFLSDFFISLSEQLISAKYDVGIYSFKSVPDQFVLESGIRINILKKKNKFQNYVQIFQIIQKEKPDIVISNFSYVNPSVLAARIVGVKHNIAWMHTVKDAMNFKRRKIKIKTEFLNLASSIITNSEELKNEVITHYKQPSEKVFNLPFTTSIKNIEEKAIDFIREKNKVYIGCPGRICTDKNQKILLDSLSLFDNDTYTLVFAGGETENIIETHPDYQKFKSRIIRLGQLNQGQMVSFYNKMDLIVLPSLNEAFGLVFIESLALGKPTFVSKRFGALSYLKEDYEAFVFNPKNPTELIEKIERYLKSEYDKFYFETVCFKLFNR